MFNRRQGQFPPPFQPGPGRRPFPGSQTPNRPNFLSQFSTPDGMPDFNKIAGTAQQMNKIISQVSPLISTFFKR
ncbi:YppG family protein [Mesobacillus harenae]|uniref:YppG family protein n=1 Tax=Mesobacillus harenae TaxID=2213203 RepID=UPI0015809154